MTADKTPCSKVISEFRETKLRRLVEEP